MFRRIMNGIDILLLVVVAACILRGFFRGVCEPQLEIALANPLDVPPRLVHQLASGFVNPIEEIRPRRRRTPATGHDQSGADRYGLGSEELSPGERS